MGIRTSVTAGTEVGHAGARRFARGEKLTRSLSILLHNLLGMTLGVLGLPLRACGWETDRRFRRESRRASSRNSLTTCVPSRVSG